MPRKWTTADIPDLTGRVAIITGANSGTGFQTARAFARKGATTILACRNLEKGQAALDRIRQETPHANAGVLQLDLSSLASVHEFASTFRSKHDQLDILINNAGILWAPYGQTVDGFERHFGTNFLGHFALTGLLIDLIRDNPSSRVITLSSVELYLAKIDMDDLMYAGGKGFTRQRAYRRSKLANLLFAYELHRRLEATGSRAVSLAAHPGVTGTNMLDSVSYLWILKPFVPLAKRLFQSAEKGALPIIRAAVDPQAKGGQFYGPDGLLQVGGHPVVVSSSRVSRDRELAGSLWEAAEELTGIQYL